MVQQQSEYAQIGAIFSKDAPTRMRAAKQLGIATHQRLEDLDYDEFLAVVADRLAGVDAETSMPLLHRLLGHPDPLVRANAAGSVAKHDPSLGLEILEQLLQEDDREVRIRVVENLCAIRLPDVVKHLSRILLSLCSSSGGIDASDDWTRDLRRKMAFTLGLWEDPYAVMSLASAARDGDPIVRTNAIVGLAKLRSAESLPVLLRALNDPDASVRRQAARALDELNEAGAADELLRALKDPDPDVVAAAVNALVNLKDERAPTTLVRLLCTDSDRLARAALQGLEKSGYGKSVAELLQKTRMPGTDPVTQMIVVAWLGLIGDTAALPDLITALGHRAVPVRIAAARALGRLGDTASVGYLFELAEGERAPQVLIAAINALGELGEPSTAWVLRRLADSEDVDVRIHAERSLLRIGRARVTVKGSSESAHWKRTRAPRLLMKNGSFDRRI